MAKRIIARGPEGNTNPTDSRHKFPYAPNNWRVWWDTAVCLWRCQRWNGLGGIVSASKFDCVKLKFVSESQFIRLKDCDVLVGGVPFDGLSNVTVPALRFRPRPKPAAQVVMVPAIGAG